MSQFILSVQNHLEADIVAIDEPFGPSITDGNLRVMVLSDEVKGKVQNFGDFLDFCIFYSEFRFLFKPFEPIKVLLKKSINFGQITVLDRWPAM